MHHSLHKPSRATTGEPPPRLISTPPQLQPNEHEPNNYTLVVPHSSPPTRQAQALRSQTNRAKPLPELPWHGKAEPRAGSRASARHPCLCVTVVSPSTQQPSAIKPTRHTRPWELPRARIAHYHGQLTTMDSKRCPTHPRRGQRTEQHDWRSPALHQESFAGGRSCPVASRHTGKQAEATSQGPDGTSKKPIFS